MGVWEVVEAVMKGVVEEDGELVVVVVVAAVEGVGFVVKTTVPDTLPSFLEGLES